MQHSGAKSGYALYAMHGVRQQRGRHSEGWEIISTRHLLYSAEFLNDMIDNDNNSNVYDV